MSKKPSRHLIEKLLDQEKHRLHVALATEEGEWNQHEPNSGMARMFVVMLLLHVILIGGIVIYDILDTEDEAPTPSLAFTATPESSRSTDLSTPEVEKSESATSTPAAPAVDSSQYEKYTVKSGDTLPGIAKQLNVDKQALITLNGIDKGAEFDAQTTLLVPKEKLPEPREGESVVPSAVPVDRKLFEPRGDVEMTKAVGDSATSASSAAESFAATQDEPPAVSVEREAPKAIPMPQLEPRPAPAPEVVPEPVVEKTVVSAPPPAPAKIEPKPTSSPSTTHTLAAGETLYRLSVKYGVSVDALQKANNISDPGKLQIGAKLVIPAQ